MLKKHTISYVRFLEMRSFQRIKNAVLTACHRRLLGSRSLGEGAAKSKYIMSINYVKREIMFILSKKLRPKKVSPKIINPGRNKKKRR